MAKPELGSKRQCLSCGAKFYDLNKDPAICPKCGTVFQARGAEPRGRAAGRRARGRSMAEDDAERRRPGRRWSRSTRSRPSEADKDAVGDDDIDVGDEDAADDTFLEEEEEGEDDVADLIDGDIEDDEEA